MSSVALAYAALIISMALLLLITYLKRHSNFKRIEFTQRIIEQNKDVPKMVSKIIANHAKKIYSDNLEEYKSSLMRDREEMFIEETYILLNFFNTLADGIGRGVYDEDLIRINFEQDIKLFYRFSGPYLRTLRFSADFDEMFLPIEFLIKEWDNKKPKKKKVTFFG
ncbi:MULTISPECIES: DUF4760 domain-containing protein [Bacillus cereus group]|uniref:DUF4760 domain-containing protein n=1 Tax=Bacillus cereus group TaxID=86661 RepID=UPI0024AD398C|nr:MULTISPECIES: hypothetical protein [Bacillus cereus group]MDI6678828.1 hypothetical protein [Bacillus wiedmannii]MDM5254963.1 hypothetical protein [Bacillus toyonensis]